MSSGITLEDSLSNPYSITGDHAKEINAGNLGIGAGQTWQDVLASRASEVTYTNTTGRPILISAWNNDSLDSSVSTWIDGVQVIVFGGGSADTRQQCIVIVPNNSTYRLVSSNGAFEGWYELR